MKLKISHFILELILLLVAVGPIHEYFHWITLVNLGGQGYVQGTHTVVAVFPITGLWLVYLSGGLGTFLLFLFFYLLEEDEATKLAMLYFVIVSLLYGLGELAYGTLDLPKTVFNLLSLMGASIAALTTMWKITQFGDNIELRL